MNQIPLLLHGLSFNVLILSYPLIFCRVREFNKDACRYVREIQTNERNTDCRRCSQRIEANVSITAKMGSTAIAPPYASGWRLLPILPLRMIVVNRRIQVDILTVAGEELHKQRMDWLLKLRRLLFFQPRQLMEAHDPVRALYPSARRRSSLHE